MTASSIVGICNRALSEIGTRSVISDLEEGSVEAVQCSLWYDNCRTSLLRAAPWAFARKQLFLTLLGTYADATAPYPWIYKYAYPSDCIKFRYTITPPYPLDPTVVPPQVSVGPPGIYPYAPSRTCRFLINSDVDENGLVIKTILSNVENAIGVYTRDEDNPDMFDPMFDSALAAALAYKLCIPLSGNVGMRDGFRLAAEGSVLNARVADANEAINSSDHTVDWMEARNAYSSGPWNAGNNGLNWGTCYSGYDVGSWSM